MPAAARSRIAAARAFRFMASAAACAVFFAMDVPAAAAVLLFAKFAFFIFVMAAARHKLPYFFQVLDKLVYKRFVLFFEGVFDAAFKVVGNNACPDPVQGA